MTEIDRERERETAVAIETKVAVGFNIVYFPPYPQ